MLEFNNSGEANKSSRLKPATDVQLVPSVRYVSQKPETVTTKTTVIHVTRNGDIRARFDIPGTTPGEHSILLCLDGAVFREIMIDHAPIGTWIEIIKPDNTVHKYRYQG